MKKKKIDPTTGYDFETNAVSVHWTVLRTHGRGWGKQKITVGQMIRMLEKLAEAIQKDLTDLANGTLESTDTPEAPHDS